MVEPEGLREAAISWLQMRTDGGQESLTREDLNDFSFADTGTRLIAPMQGIWKPGNYSAALSFRTSYTEPGKTPPYEDSTGADGRFRYKWRGTDPDHPENIGLREALYRRLPLIWFRGVAMNPARYQAITPVYIVDEEPEHQQFVFVAAEDVEAAFELSESAHETVARRYLLRMAKARVHQPVFRSMVLSAYENRCAVCMLAHPSLLDAAHIVPDNDERGVAAVINGLAMCKIHHAAFDRFFLGIRPDYVVEIRHDLLEEADGPMLRHGLQELHGNSLMSIPKSRRDRPNADLLEDKYEQFRNATKNGVA
ncbi:HNH endonuclease [Brevibacterium aurantiacum]|uniref:HNH endonuclease n=1 Tax=Brevibacterium aurantiacum TaxID=273384 RepID=UPI001F0A215B|nr:HNH endonuclease [Brevibacterium aurantiacum]